MNKLQSFEQYFTTTNLSISPTGFLLNMLLGFVLSCFLALIYRFYGHALSDRRAFGRNFILITLATLTIITIVKSSLALSLGLVGALSVVRFRSAIKEPEELAFLFISIAMGLGLGADQRLITCLAFGFIALFLVVRGLLQKGRKEETLNLTLSSQSVDNQPDIEQLIEMLRPHTGLLALRRMDESADFFEVVFTAGFNNFDALNQAKKSVREKYPQLNFSVLDLKGLAE